MPRLMRSRWSAGSMTVPSAASIRCTSWGSLTSIEYTRGPGAARPGAGAGSAAVSRKGEGEMRGRTKVLVGPIAVLVVGAGTGVGVAEARHQPLEVTPSRLGATLDAHPGALAPR